jgi:hypothetical protein
MTAALEVRERIAQDRDDRQIARRALNQADDLLGDLEELQLRGETEIPPWSIDTAKALRWASIEARIRDPRLETESGVVKLIDDVYTLEERLMRRLRRRPVSG